MAVRQRRAGLMQDPGRTRAQARMRQASMRQARANLTYEPLDRNRNQIRILRLLPSYYDRDPIKCTLYTAYLDDEPEYEALSYVWGDPHSLKSIIVNGAPTLVTVNLELALRRLRDRIHPRNLWVDAICINQNDDTERSHQVNLMRDIFASTTEAILWLGDYRDGQTIPVSMAQSNAEESSINEQSSHIDSGPRITYRKAVLAFNLMKRMSLNEHFAPEDGSIDEQLTSETLLALNDLMLLPWWKRVWTVQEAILPTRAILVYGAINISLRKFLRAIHYSSTHLKARCCSWRLSPHKFWTTGAVKDSVKSSPLGLNTFLFALHTFRLREASDPRDHVFALLGLGGREAIEANYSMPTQEAFVRSTRNLITHSKSLFPLLRQLESTRLPDLPSWVPDWSAPSEDVDVLRELFWISMSRYFSASKAVGVQTRSTSTESVLDLRGHMVDRIQEVGDVLPTAGKNTEACLQVIRQWESIKNRYCSENSDYYPLGGKFSDAFWRVMAFDIVSAESNDPIPGYRRACPMDERRCRGMWSHDTFDFPLGIGGRRFFITEKGMIGAGERDTRPGDVVYVLFGGDMPFVLRLVGSAEHKQHEYIGHAYVHGIMDGEMLDHGRSPEWISLV